MAQSSKVYEKNEIISEYRWKISEEREINSSYRRMGRDENP